MSDFMAHQQQIHNLVFGVILIALHTSIILIPACILDWQQVFKYGLVHIFPLSYHMEYYRCVEYFGEN